MNDLISREAAINAAFKGVDNWDGGFNPKYLIELPAVDAVPVVHGRWIFHDDDMMPWVECSECGVCTDSLNKTNYCPRCGAKMDGDVLN